MKSFSKILIAGLLAGGLSAPAFAQISSGQSTDASITIIRPVVLTKVTDLAFGTVTRAVTGDNTITMSTTSNTPSTSVLNSYVGGSPTRASYTVTGETGRTVAISLNAATATLSRSGGGTLTLTLDLANATDTLTGANGNFSFGTLYVGGNIVIPDTALSGAYTGSFTTTVAYN